MFCQNRAKVVESVRNDSLRRKVGKLGWPEERRGRLFWQFLPEIIPEKQGFKFSCPAGCKRNAAFFILLHRHFAVAMATANQ